jgi:hypothetical protein
MGVDGLGFLGKACYEAWGIPPANAPPVPEFLRTYIPNLTIETRDLAG